MTGLEFVLFIKEMQYTEVAEKMGVSVQLVGHWTKGRRPISKEKQKELESWLGIPSMYLIKEMHPHDRLMLEHLLLTQEGYETDNLYERIGAEFALLNEKYTNILNLYNKEKEEKENMKKKLIKYVEGL